MKQPAGNKLLPGMAFRDGKLYLFGWKVIKVLRPWGPKAGAWRLDLRMPMPCWKPFRPGNLDLYSMYLVAKVFGTPMETATPVSGNETGRKSEPEALARFFDEIPEEILGLVSGIPERQWHCLQLMNRVGETADMFQSNAGLAFLLASNWLFQSACRRPMDFARRAVRKKQRVILASLGFPENDSTLKILKKFDKQDLRIGSFFELRAILTDLQNQKKIKSLCHLEKLNGEIVKLIRSEYFGIVSAQVFLEMLEKPSYPVFFKIQDIACFGKNIPRFKVGKLVNLKRIDEIHHDVVELVLKKGKWVAPFPRPPIPADPDFGITALDTPEKLFNEGEEMRNCVYSYAEDVYLKNLYFYKIHKEGLKRSTFSIRKKKYSEEWETSNIVAFANEEIGSFREIDFIYNWLKSNGKIYRHFDEEKGIWISASTDETVNRVN